MSKTFTIKSLLSIMRKLREPETGCPWDLEQDFKSIAAYTIEEAYEVADVIERDALHELQDELGDLLLQVVFHSQMAHEQDLFEFNDVVTSICHKMLRRPPHVFSDAKVQTAKVQTAEEQTDLWDKLKAEERQAKHYASILDGIPSNLPGLSRAQKLTRRAAKVGFDWPNVESVFVKFEEESKELIEAIQTKNQDHIEE